MKFARMRSIAEKLFGGLARGAGNNFCQKNKIALKSRQQQRKTATWRDTKNFLV
jgi:hypothetical protein